MPLASSINVYLMWWEGVQLHTIRPIKHLIIFRCISDAEEVVLDQLGSGRTLCRPCMSLIMAIVNIIHLSRSILGLASSHLVLFFSLLVEL